CAGVASGLAAGCGFGVGAAFGGDALAEASEAPVVFPAADVDMDAAPAEDPAAFSVDDDAAALAAGVCGGGVFTSVALRSSVAWGRFVPVGSVRPASFAGSGLSIMGAGVSRD